MIPDLTPEQLDEAKRLREQWQRNGRKLGCRTIAARLGVHMAAVRRVFENGYSLCTTVRERQERIKRGTPTQRSRIVRCQTGPKMFVPEFVIEERNQRASTPYQSLTAALLGDPKPGCSALDRRG